MNFNRTLLFLLLSTSGIAGFAQDATGSGTATPAPSGAAQVGNVKKTWTFNDCLAYALEHSADVKQALLAVRQADEDIGAAKDAYLPNVGFSTNQGFTNYPVKTEGRTQNAYTSSYGVNANWTVWEGNVRKYRLESSKILKRQQELSGADVEKELTLGILSAYLNIMYAREAVEIARQTLEVSTSQAERACRLMEAGRTSKVDYAQMESQKAQDEYNLVQAQNELASAQVNLKKLLTLGIDSDIEIADPLLSDSEINVALPTKEQTYTAAAAWLPDIKSNELNKEIYANDIKIAKAGNLPDISLQGGIGTGYSSGGNGWGWQMGHGLNENVGVAVNVPIYNGNSTKRAVAKAKLASLEYDINRQRLLDNLSQTIEGLYIDADNARARYSSGTTRLEATQLTADLVNRQFELGLVNPLELLTAHNNLLNSRLELLQSKFMAILANKTINYYATSSVSL